MKRRALLAGIAATALVASLSGCTLASALTPPVESELYATKADATGPQVTIPLPSFVPDDAQMIRIKQNAETGDAILKWDDPAPEDLGVACDPPLTEVSAPLDDTWWPQQISPDSVACFDDWRVARIGATFVAWKDGVAAS